MFFVGYVYDELMLLHQSDDLSFPECPNRIKVIYDELLKRNYLPFMVKIESKNITYDELLMVHGKKYIDKLIKIFSQNNKVIKAHFQSYDSMYANEHSLTSSGIAAGSTLNLMKSILNGTIRHGVAIVRPPGHHGKTNCAAGFCIFNNIAISAKYVLEQGYRVAIIDFDVHFGDGTYQLLKKEKQSLFISIHRYDHGEFYPGTGKARNTANILSIPINYDAFDDDYYRIFDQHVISKLNKFNPDIILISAGFDAAEGDPLGGFHLTPNCYYNMTKMLLAYKKPVMLVLEGGYNLTSVANSMSECVRALLEDVDAIKN